MPGLGFLALYRTVVSRIQHLWFGSTTNPSPEYLDRVRQQHADSLKAIQEAGVIVFGPEAVRSSGSLGLEANLGLVYYDDTGTQNTLFRRLLCMAAFDDNSKNFAQVVGVRMLSKADIRYKDAQDDHFAGFEDEEQQAQENLRRIKPHLFAFRAHASFIPESQRLRVSEEGRFRELWEDYSKLKIEVVSKLHYGIGGGEFTPIAEDFRVFLRHWPEDENGVRHLFVRQSLLRDDGLPLRELGRPLAAVLGSEAQVIAIEMLLSEFDRDPGLSRLEGYLQDRCGVLPDQIREIQRLDQEFQTRRVKEQDELLSSLKAELERLGFKVEEQIEHRL